jgi:putative nucleotidyltransferase with HDIG domain
MMVIGFETFVNGLGSAMLAAGGGILLGRLFGITTTWQLLELANPTHPLLRRLMSEAPGTYHHSLIVGNLAERSAEEVGADPLLARVAAYYHDVGKLRRPYFFVENQIDGVNAHQSLSPIESARIIAAHVTDGVELAERYGLPPRIREMIPQHHGTRLVSFFYQQATQDSNAEVRVEDFTYAGPKPQSKEAAIVMLADSCEAAARASRDHSPDAIVALVEKIIIQRLSEGQLDECDLTLRDLQRIKQSFCTLLIGMYHPRIEYPDKLENGVAPAALTPPAEQLEADGSAPSEDAPVASPR